MVPGQHPVKCPVVKDWPGTPRDVTMPDEHCPIQLFCPSAKALPLSQEQLWSRGNSVS